MKTQVKFMSQDAVDVFKSEVDLLLNAIDLPNAFVTDGSQVYDFTIGLEVQDDAVDAHNKTIMDALEGVMGRPVSGPEYLWELARELHHKQKNIVLH